MPGRRLQRLASLDIVPDYGEYLAMTNHTYEAPTLVPQGRLGDITGGSSAPVTKLDAPYPVSTPYPALTWSH